MSSLDAAVSLPMQNEHLNLARKWRSKNFEEVVGQDLSVKMLRNSLYLNQLFPVYLFSGQRGCGKTSTARIFAAAVNCEQLAIFQQQPKTTAIPCQACTSCIAMGQGKHPDFFEIDAASHTGVDNVRNIIDSSTFLPLMGRKKIYLIDEAHMLSRAAFNALLKVLEEPSPSTLFILATTDIQKILETVRSRCFQLFFKPVETKSLFNHLKNVCTTEAIMFDQAGLMAIINETEGSVRDALNLLEQVRFSSSSVTKQSVHTVLGYVDDESMLNLFEIILKKDPQALLQLLQDMQFTARSVEFMWRKLTEIVRAALWLKYGVASAHMVEYHAHIKTITAKYSAISLIPLFEHLCLQELPLSRTTAKHSFFEMILLQLCTHKKGRKGDSDNNSGFAAQVSQREDVAAQNHNISDEDISEDDEEHEDDEDENFEGSHKWKQFLQELERHGDQLITSVFMQARFKSFDASTSVVTAELSKKFIFFKDRLDAAIFTWQPFMRSHFGQAAVFTPIFKDNLEPETKLVQKQSMPVNTQQAPAKPAAQKIVAKPTFVPQQNGPFVKNNWRKSSLPSLSEPRVTVFGPQATMLLKYFPGTITQLEQRL